MQVESCTILSIARNDSCKAAQCHCAWLAIGKLHVCHPAWYTRSNANHVLKIGVCIELAVHDNVLHGATPAHSKHLKNQKDPKNVQSQRIQTMKRIQKNTVSTSEIQQGRDQCNENIATIHIVRDGANAVPCVMQCRSKGTFIVQAFAKATLPVMNNMWRSMTTINVNKTYSHQISTRVWKKLRWSEFAIWRAEVKKCQRQWKRRVTLTTGKKHRCGEPRYGIENQSIQMYASCNCCRCSRESFLNLITIWLITSFSTWPCGRQTMSRGSCPSENEIKKLMRWDFALWKDLIASTGPFRLP